MNNVYIILIIIAAFIAMEGVAWLAHKYLMHGFLWFLHEDHHVPKKRREGFFEKNDWFFVIFAFPSMILYITGSLLGSPFLFAMAIGITLYGVAYFIFHEVVFHRRLKWFRKWRTAYIRGVKLAHSMHHRHLNQEEGECFGLLLFPYKYYRLELNKK